jgi:cell division septation protein DedD
MVQIAAVGRRDDADVLVTALQNRGYHVSVRTETTDQLLHVQIGPFTTRDQARAMQARLLNDGYNAILK